MQDVLEIFHKLLKWRFRHGRTRRKDNIGTFFSQVTNPAQGFADTPSDSVPNNSGANTSAY